MAGPEGATLQAPPKGATAKKIGLARAGEVALELPRQLLSGIDDITYLFTKPLAETFGDIRFTVGPGISLGFQPNIGVEFVGPEEVKRLRQAGDHGIPGRATEEPTSLIGKGSRVAGQTLAAGPILGRLFGLVKAPAAIPLAAAVTPATRVGKVLRGGRKILHQSGRTFAKSPIAATAIESGFGFTAGSGGYIAEKVFPDSPAATFMGEMIGGVAPALLPARILIRSGGGVRNIFKTIRHPLTEIGGRIRAAKRAKRALSGRSRKTAIEALDQPTTIDPVTGEPVLTPAQRTGEAGLLSMEKSIIDSSETLKHLGDEQIAHANSVLQQSLDDAVSGGAATKTATTIKEAQNYMTHLLETRMRIAAQRVDDRVADFGKNINREQLNRIAREEIEGALTAARAQEKEFFMAIPENTPVPFARAAAKFRFYLQELGTAQRGDLPRAAKELLDENSKLFFGKNAPEGFIPGETTIKEIRSLQSKLRENARIAGAAGKRNIARISNGIADAITEDLANTRGGQGSTAEETAKAVQVAVDFSRELNERFGDKTVAKILGRTPTGAPAVPASLTLEESIGMSGPKAREGMDQILKAFDSPEAPGNATVIEATQDYIRAKFLKETTFRGEFNTRYADKFLANNEELLKRMPVVRQQIKEAIESGDKMAVALRQSKRVKLDDHRVSKATMLTQKGPVETFKQMSHLDAKQMGTETQKLINMASRDATGEALDGLRAGYLEYLYSTSRLGIRDVEGMQFISGFSLKETLEKTAPAAKKLFSTEQLKRIAVIQDDLIRLEKRRAATHALEGVIEDRPSKLIETVAGIAGAAVGRSESRRLGIGGTVQIPGIMANRFRALANAGVKDPASRLLRDSVFDESLYKELLQTSIDESGKMKPEAIRRLNAWTAAVIAEYGGTFDETEE